MRLLVYGSMRHPFRGSHRSTAVKMMWEMNNAQKYQWSYVSIHPSTNM